LDLSLGTFFLSVYLTFLIIIFVFAQFAPLESFNGEVFFLPIIGEQKLAL
jgi:hypothetical protein